MRKFLISLLLASACLCSQAQLQTEDSIGITRERWRDSMLRMDKQYVPTGILLEYSLFPFDANKFDGLNNDDDTLKDAGNLYMLHNILKDGIVNSNASLPLTDSLFSKAFWHNRNTGNMPFTLFTNLIIASGNPH